MLLPFLLSLPFFLFFGVGANRQVVQEDCGNVGSCSQPCVFDQIRTRNSWSWSWRLRHSMREAWEKVTSVYLWCVWREQKGHDRWARRTREKKVRCQASQKYTRTSLRLALQMFVLTRYSRLDKILIFNKIDKNYFISHLNVSIIGSTLPQGTERVLKRAEQQHPPLDRSDTNSKPAEGTERVRIPDHAFVYPPRRALSTFSEWLDRVAEPSCLESNKVATYLQLFWHVWSHSATNSNSRQSKLCNHHSWRRQRYGNNIFIERGQGHLSSADSVFGRMDSLLTCVIPMPPHPIAGPFHIKPGRA